MAKTTIKIKDVLADFQAGLHPNAVNAKYGLTPAQFQKILLKLQEMDLLKELERSGVSQLVGFLHKCPSCGLLQVQEFADCPRCGVVVAKAAPALALSRGRSETRPAQRFQKETTLVSNSKRGYAWTVALVAACAVAVTGVYWGWNKYEHSKQAERVKLVDSMVRDVLEPVASQGQANWPVVSNQLKKILTDFPDVWMERKGPLKGKLGEIIAGVSQLGDLERQFKQREQASAAESASAAKATKERQSLEKKLDAARNELGDLQRQEDVQRAASEQAARAAEREAARIAYDQEVKYGIRVERVTTHTYNPQLQKLEKQKSSVQSRIAKLEDQLFSIELPTQVSQQSRISSLTKAVNERREYLLTLCREVLEALEPSRR